MIRKPTRDDLFEIALSEKHLLVFVVLSAFCLPPVWLIDRRFLLIAFPIWWTHTYFAYLFLHALGFRKVAVLLAPLAPLHPFIICWVNFWLFRRNKIPLSITGPDLEHICNMGAWFDKVGRWEAGHDEKPQPPAPQAPHDQG